MYTYARVFEKSYNIIDVTKLVYVR